MISDMHELHKSDNHHGRLLDDGRLTRPKHNHIVMKALKTIFSACSPLKGQRTTSADNRTGGMHVVNAVTMLKTHWKTHWKTNVKLRLLDNSHCSSDAGSGTRIRALGFGHSVSSTACTCERLAFCGLSLGDKNWCPRGFDCLAKRKTMRSTIIIDRSGFRDDCLANGWHSIANWTPRRNASDDLITCLQFKRIISRNRNLTHR